MIFHSFTWQYFFSDWCFLSLLEAGHSQCKKWCDNGLYFLHFEPKALLLFYVQTYQHSHGESWLFPQSLLPLHPPQNKALPWKMYLLPSGEQESGEICEQNLLEEEGGILMRRYLLAGQRIFLGSSDNDEFCPLWQPLLDSAGAKVRVRPRTGGCLSSLVTRYCVPKPIKVLFVSLCSTVVFA